MNYRIVGELMTITTWRDEPYQTTASFITVSRCPDHVHVQEWDMVNATRAEAMMDIKLADAEYDKVVGAYYGDELQAQRAVIAHAHRRSDHSLDHYLTNVARKILPAA